MLSPETVRALRVVVKKYLPHTSVPKPGRWRRLDDDANWKHFVMQVGVAGKSAPATMIAERWGKDLGIEIASLRPLPPRERRKAIHLAIRTCGVRFASASISRCRKTEAIAHNYAFLASWPDGPSGYLSTLGALPDDSPRALRLRKDMTYIKLKGSRDLLADLGLAVDVIALDVRILNVLKALGVDLPKGVTISPSRYEALESELLEKVCRPLGLTGVAFDRVLYQNYPDIQREGCRGKAVATAKPPLESALMTIERHFHAVIRARAGKLINEHGVQLPRLGSVTSRPKREVSFPIPGMYGGFNYWLTGEGVNRL
jgi:hypothetical protein